MALTKAATGGPASERRAASGAPTWTIALYLAGLLLIYVGEHVLVSLERGATVVTALGLLATLVATALRFAPRFRVGGERKSIESLLALLSAIGLVGVLIYFLTDGALSEKLGIDAMPVERRDAIRELSRVIWVSLIVISTLPMVFVETALRPMRSSERPESRRVRAAAGAGLSLALAAIYGSLIVYAASGVDLRVDYSYFRTSRPSDSTLRYVQSMNEELRVVAFFPEVNEVRNEVASYLRELAPGAPKLKVEIHDRLLVPKLAKELRAVQDGVVVLSRGTSIQSLSIGTELDTARPKLKTLDRDFQEQLLKILRARRTAYFTVGHGEINDSPRASADESQRSAQIVRTLIQRQNFTIRDLGLAQGLGRDVPDDADIVLVLGPTETFSREEVQALGRYAARGGRLVLALDSDAFSTKDLVTAETPPGAPAPGTPPAATSGTAPAAAGSAQPPGTTATGVPGSASGSSVATAPGAAAAQELSEIVGLTFTAEPLANDKHYVPVRYNESDRICLVTNSFSSHASVTTLSRNSGRAAVVMFGAGSLERAKNAGDAKIDFTIRSMSGTFRDKNRNYTEDADEKSAGVFNLAAAVTKPLSQAAATASNNKDAGKDKSKAKPPEVQEMRAFVIADADAFSDLVMGRVVGNQVLFVDGLRWLVGEESVQGLPNTEEDKRIEHTKQVDLGWFYATIFGAPALVLGLGLFVSRRSRNVGGKR
jgi:hypothetical protein